ncbi:hypothetical protein GCK32_014427, partial [Trichostrongylus colubriformis]
MIQAVYWTCETISILSIAVNCYLLYVYWRCPLKAVHSYKYFFLLTAIYGIIFSSCLLLLVPVILFQGYSIIFVAIGPLHESSVGQLLMLLFCMAFISSLLIITNSFFHRYLQVCRVLIGYLYIQVILFHGYSIIFVAIGPLHESSVGQLLMLLFCMAFISSLLIITNSFFHRYLQVCRSVQL